MLRGNFDSAAEMAPDELAAAYESRLEETLEAVGLDTVQQTTDLPAHVLDALGEGVASDLELADAAAILATDPERPAAADIEAEARDLLLLGMSSAVLDVEALASGINYAMEPKDIQQKVEGRQPVTLREYAILHRYIESEKH